MCASRPAISAERRSRRGARQATRGEQRRANDRTDEGSDERDERDAKRQRSDQGSGERSTVAQVNLGTGTTTAGATPLAPVVHSRARDYHDDEYGRNKRVRRERGC